MEKENISELVGKTLSGIDDEHLERIKDNLRVQAFMLAVLGDFSQQTAQEVIQAVNDYKRASV